MDEILNLLDQLDQKHLEFAEYQKRAKDEIGQLQDMLFSRIKTELQSCKVAEAKRLANQIYWYGIDYPGIAKKVKQLWKESFNGQFIPDPINTDTDCSKCNTPFMATSINQYKSIQLEKEPICDSCKITKNREDAKRYAEEAAVRRARLQTLQSIPYEEYLQTPEWDITRKEALRRAKYKCQLCNSNGILHVHHKNYLHRGQEWASDLIVLCADCHAKHHDIYVRNNNHE